MVNPQEALRIARLAVQDAFAAGRRKSQREAQRRAADEQARTLRGRQSEADRAAKVAREQAAIKRMRRGSR